MKSKLLNAMDYRIVDIRSMIKPFTLDSEALEQELRRITNPYIRWEEGNKVLSGAQVTCRLRSSCSRFNRDQIKFVAGSGIFHKELEELSTGMAVGETREIELPEGRTALTVTEVLNRVVPEPNDSMVERLGLDGISDLAGYRAYLVALQKEKYLESELYEPVQYLRSQVLEGSEFILFKEDWRTAADMKLDRCRVLSRQEGLILEEMTPEQFNGRIPVRSYYQLVAMIQDEAWDNLRMYLLGEYFAQTDGFAVGETDYAAYIADYARSWHTSEAQAREIDPYESFLFNEYASHAYAVLQHYVKDQF